MHLFFLRHKNFWRNYENIMAAISGMVLFGLALWLNVMASRYATEAAGNSVPDLILSHVPVFKVDWIVNEIALLFIIFVVGLIIMEPRRLPFVAKSVALFMLVRSISISLTHIGLFPTRSYIDPTDWLSFTTLGADLFFSGHTGIAFLMSLIFWDNRIVRYICLSTSVLFGTAMLLGHLHYSIDIFSAYFITYTIYVLCERWFKKDKTIFDSVS